MLLREGGAGVLETGQIAKENILQKSILIVDDLEMNRSMIIKQLGEHYKTYEAENGIEALEILGECQIDLIITDIFMDKMNGYELMKHVKSISAFRDIPIIAVTENNESSQKRAIEAGADIYIDRPLGGFITGIVAKLTGRDHGRKELFDMDFLLDTIPGAVIVYNIKEDGEMKIVSCSRGVNQLSGWEADEFCNADTAENVAAIYPADLDKFNRTIKKMITTHSRGEVIYRGYRKDGSMVWIWFQGRYIGEEDGCAVVEAILLDVSNNTNMYQSILDASTSAITVVDARTFEVLYANSHADELVNRKHEAYLGSTCYEFVFHRDKPCERCIANKHNREWCEEEFERNGKFYRQIFRRITWHGIEAFLEYTIDVSMEKENIAYAEEQKNLQSQILQNIPTGIIVYELKNSELRLVETNQSLCDMMNLSKDKLRQSRNMDFFALVHEDDIEMCKGVLEKLSVPNADLTYEFRSYDRKQKKYVWMSGHGRSVEQPNGSIYIYFAYTDISARKELENTEHRLFVAQKTAEAKAEFYSRMSHDMRTPMNGILGITELAHEDKDIETLKADIAKIEQSGKYMLNLINDTLDYQRLDSGKTKLNPDVIYARDLLNNAMAMLKITADSKGVELSLDCDAVDMDWYIKVDEMCLKQIFINVISNAIKFTPDGGRVNFKIERLGIDGLICHEKMTISDTGIGMSRSFLENELFKPFSQEKNDITMNNAGSGLGLSIVKSLVELMNGRIEVESEIGSGTQFNIYLDIERVDKKDAEAHNRKDAARLKSDIDLSGKRVLLCEDHPLNAEIVKRLLQRVKAEAEWAKNGEEGVGMFKNSKPAYYDAILMDIRMPKIDGLEATRQIRQLDREDAKKIPIIAMSANAYEEDIKKSLEAGMNAHLAKPVEAYQVYETLNQYIVNNQ